MLGHKGTALCEPPPSACTTPRPQSHSSRGPGCAARSFAQLCLVSLWSWGPPTSSHSVSGRGLGQPPHAFWLPTKATQPTCLCLSLLTPLSSSSANHLPTGHLGTGQGAGLLTDTGGIPGHVYLPPLHTHPICPHSHRGHVRHEGHATTPGWPHSHRGEVAWGGSGEGPTGSSSRRVNLKCP